MENGPDGTKCHSMIKNFLAVSLCDYTNSTTFYVTVNFFLSRISWLYPFATIQVLQHSMKPSIFFYFLFFYSACRLTSECIKVIMLRHQTSCSIYHLCIIFLQAWLGTMLTWMPHVRVGLADVEARKDWSMAELISASWGMAQQK